MSEISTTSWYCRLACGKVLRGKQTGSFANIKHRHDIIDLWVETGAGRIHAARHQHINPTGFDFFVHVVADLEGGKTEKYFKLITKYEDHQLIRYVKPDGENYTEKVNGNKE